MKGKPLVSIIIPTKNSEQFLERCLNSIVKQTYKNIEIILVDNNSDDMTKSIALRYTKKVYNKGPERAAQTNFGIEKARGEFIYRIDGDFVLERGVVSEAVEKCLKFKLDGVAIHNTSDPTVSFWAKVRKFERDMYKQDSLVVGVRFYKRSSWKDIGGYHEDMVLDDYDFHNRFIQKYKWGRIKAKECHLGEPKTLKEIFMKNYYYGSYMVRYLKQYPGRGLMQSHPFRKTYFEHISSFYKNPVLSLGFFVMMIVKYSGGMLGFISAIIINRK